MATEKTVARVALEKFNPQHFSTLLQNADALFGMTSEEIKDSYRHIPISIRKTYDEELEFDSVELQFDNENGILTCYFNKHNQKCDQVVVGFNSLVDPDDYIAALNVRYAYSYLHHCWQIPQGTIHVNKCLSGISIMIFKPVVS